MRVEEARNWCVSFADETLTLLSAVFPREPQLVDKVTAVGDTNRAKFAVTCDLTMRGREDRELGIRIEYEVGPDRSGQHIAIHKSSFKVGDWARDGKKVSAVLRYEYDRLPRRWVSAHIHIHQDIGAFTRARTLRDIPAPHVGEKLHYPVGGDRFRPGLEDFLFFLIKECGFEGREGWEQSLSTRRDIYRRLQARSVVRDYHEEAADVLRQLGYEVTGAPNINPSEPHTHW